MTVTYILGGVITNATITRGTVTASEVFESSLYGGKIANAQITKDTMDGSQISDSRIAEPDISGGCC
jgi:hypothetical protein